MADLSFLHGIEVVTITNGVRPIQTARSSVIGLIGTAPLADTGKFPVNVPVLVNSKLDYALIGATGTLKDALDAIFDQAAPVVVVIRVAAGATTAASVTNIIGGVDNAGVRTGVEAFKDAETLLGVTPRILIAPGFTGDRPTGATAVAFATAGAGYTSAPSVVFAGGGTDPDKVLPTAHAVLTAGAVSAIVIDNPGRNLNAAVTYTFSGGSPGTAATPGTVTTAAGPNPIVTSLLAIANMLGAHIIAEGPSTTDAAALTYRNDWGSRRVYVVDPKVKRYDTAAEAYISKPASPGVAGLIARVDSEIGFWKSPSNEVVNGVGGLDRQIDWASGDPNSRANILNENEVATFIRDEGWRLWGNRTCSSDPLYAFLSVSRTKDMIDISIKQAQRFNVDGVVNKAFFDDVAASVNGYLRQLKTRGAILGGECWYDPAKNTDTDLLAGHVTFSYKFTPPPVAERITFESAVVSDYLVSIFE